ncbi:MAG: hypothetical protein FJ267_06010 [Planctomycetes bacterium]|nr:hypothetical protein [Planctomycetota bacterium]
MNSRSIERASELLVSRYGRQNVVSLGTMWEQALRIICGVSHDHAFSAEFSELLESTILGEPAKTFSASNGQLLETLKTVPRGQQKASVVKSLAGWWISRFENCLDPEWVHGLDEYRGQLRAIRGLGPAIVDELLLFVGRLRVFPVDRPALRIAVRHGWIDLPAEDSDVQSFFVQGCEQSNVEPREFSLQLAIVGKDHCWREPLCDGCPLQSMLPSCGPINPDAC